ncbi:uncharacterized protein LOC105844605 [Hydra vulgaris]|uniref:uncharacterized protein LOC105844605 n=1 Tax=Hydra vulgaris TaxID=6087 RepID=UPI001F5EF89D|nr:uncharacterized protein LOC105844605 [Hydra vulgaris]
MASSEDCNSTHEITELSSFSFSFSIIICLLTVATNLAVIFSLLRKKNILRQSTFHKILLNIALADLLTGLISDPISISFHGKEMLRIPISCAETKALHVTLFIINGTSILTMVLLCIDRVIALKWPILYRNGLANWKCLLVLSSTWALSSILVISYFEYGYVKYLAVFSTTAVATACVSLFMTIGIFRLHIFNKSSKSEFNLFKNTKANNLENSGKENRIDNISSKENSSNDTQSNSSNCKDNIRTEIKSKKKLKIERSVNKSFINMLVVFLLSYLPACVMIAYMNTCDACNCILIHVARDLTYLIILSSAFFRPVNFIYRLKMIKVRFRLFR